MEALSAPSIRTGLSKGRIGNQVLVFGTIGSTNDLAAECARQRDSNGLVVLAEHQTAGRGRSGNRWHCGYGQGILCSVVIKQGQFSPEGLSLAAALACADAIGPRAKIKWPNDIVLGDKKVAGILVEARVIGEEKTFIVGIGINCHQQLSDIPVLLQSQATSLYLATGKHVDRNVLTRRLLVCLDQWVQIASSSIDQVVAGWQRRSTQIGQRLTIAYKGSFYTGTCIGVDATQGLILQLDHGSIRLFESGHSHVVHPGKSNQQPQPGSPTAPPASRSAQHY